MKSLLKIKKSTQKLREQNKTIEIPAFLGDLSGIVKADDNNSVYVVLFNGEVQVVRNDKVPPIPRLPVIIGNDTKDSTLRILRMREAFSDPPYVNLPAHADKTHQWPQVDTLWVKPEQFLSGIAIPSSGMLVEFIGFVYYLNGWHLLNTQSIDLTAYIPTDGANYVLVQVDETKTISFVEGTSKPSREVLEYADIPIPTLGQKPLFAVKMYKGQTRIIKAKFTTDIIDLRFAGFASGVGAGVTAVVSTLALGGDSFRFSAAGPLVIVENIDSPLIVARDINIYNWRVYLRETGISGASIFDVNKNGVTVFTNQANRPTITFDHATGQAISGIADIVSFLAGDIITFDIDGVAEGAESLSVVGSTLINVIVTVDAGQHKDAGDADPVFTYTSSVSGLAFSGSLSRDAGEGVGAYAITQGSLSLPSGYLVTFVSNTFEIVDDLTASSASVINTWSGSSAYLIDGNDATLWESSTRRDASPWCHIDLGSSKEIRRVRVLQDDTGWKADQFRIDISDNATDWTTEYTSGATLAENLVSMSVSARYIRIVCTSGGNWSGWKVYDVSARGY